MLIEGDGKVIEYLKAVNLTSAKKKILFQRNDTMQIDY